VRTTFTNNTARNNGGAIYAVRNSGQAPTSVWVHASTFSGNSTAIAGFTATSSGGAIYVRDAELFVAESTFEGNAAGWVGGAIYGWGTWNGIAPYCDYSAPSTDIVIADSLFADNRADDAANPSQVPQTGRRDPRRELRARRAYRSLFESNGADWGGAISVDHAASIVEQSVFRYNYATVPDTGNAYPTGGTFVSLNGDLGSADHPTPELQFRRVLVQGGRAGQPGAATAHSSAAASTCAATPRRRSRCPRARGSRRRSPTRPSSTAASRSRCRSWS
jgi:predicted outer membrane repeat protein